MAGKKSIAFVANTSWSIYKFRLYLIKKLIEEGFTLYILAPRDPYTLHFEQIPGLTYIELKKMRGKSLSPWQDYLLYRELLGHYRSLQPSLIFHYTIKANIFGSLAASRAHIPAVSVITGLGYTFSGNGWLQTAVRLLYRTALRRNAGVWFLNSDDRDIFTAGRLVRPEKTFLLPGEGVDTEFFYPVPYEAGKDTVTFLLIGRMIRHKGIYEFVEAAGRLQQQGLSVRCQLLGFFDDNSPVAIPHRKIEEWNRRRIVTYLGHTDDVTPYIAQADCIVLPSWREGMPLSLLEAASMCKGLIATDTAGCRAIIEEGVNGFLCREKNGADLAEKMAAYYHLPVAAKRQMGMEGRNRVLQSFTNKIITEIYLDKINTLRATGHEH